ncbi:catalytic domain of components of various dehydrogenase complexes [Candidatus Amoebophilus asiaticus 5a2]|uniref:Dihydrolipoamide acetyltransferase component of pyruvate dehydrogenase complex n=1 Tax=Amoebophilus asiaticus (strain 5a2) TaxID=452471 RepID=B3EU67_AMOA5|nr:dihydrolipoamide acetyltransferase family protein [Candidatus Amoebophilus asiaticus]ACE05486.1 catalytic domain of components of various dehydrogenase complexes [Candidatus Amoebophilus asiaticus 5a2]
MAEVIRMPKMSDTMVEGVIAAWLKKVGDTVKSGDILAEVETDKATMELEAYESGTILYVGVQEKQTVPINGVLAIIGKPNEDISALLTEIQQNTAPQAASENVTTTVSASPTTLLQPELPQPNLNANNTGRTLISPLAKKMAQAQGHDITTIQGTGENGRIIKRDIESLVNRQIANSSWSIDGSSNLQEAWETIPVSQIRKTIARRLIESKSAAPHFYLSISVNMDTLVAARVNLNQYTSVKITFNDIIIKAVAVAIKQHLQVNTAWLGDTIRYNKHIHIGVAMAVEAGLLVPVVKFADHKSLSQIATEVKTLTQRAHNNQLQPSDWEGSTFTISNLGMLGIESFTAIVNPPASCILAVGAIQQVPIVKEGTIVPGHVMKVTLSCDHRVVDGAVGAAFLKTLKELLEEPLRLLV